ncbi:MAG: polyprenyl synthetase family protein [Proteobacteria bacterium]|nr:polyprenyl synthetase family protein [Pseudomonadota bacterium]
MPFLESLRGYQSRVETALAHWLPAADIQPDHLHQAMRYAVLGDGKRIRPVLVYASGEAFGVDLAVLDGPACAVEMIHAYSLIHDDLPVMDDDDLRRGKPTVHKAFDEATAILVGDALQSLAYQLLSGNQEVVNGKTQLQMLNVLSEAAGAAGMVGGQSLDNEAIGHDLTLSELETMHSLKTGALIRSSVVLGGMSHAQASESQLGALTQYASHIGLAFQIQDDILDETSDTETLGKPQGSDRQQNKPTYVSLLGLDQARDKATELADQAIASLSGFPGSADRLRELAFYVVERIH